MFLSTRSAAPIMPCTFLRVVSSLGMKFLSIRFSTLSVFLSVPSRETSTFLRSSPIAS